MSFILDALKKSQQERDAAIDDELRVDDGEDGVTASRRFGKRGIVLAAVGVFIAVDVVLAGWYFELFPPFSRPQGDETIVTITEEPASEDTAAEPEPAPTPATEPVADPAETPVAEPTPTPVAEPAPTPVAEPAPTPVAEPVPMPMEEPGAPAPPEEFPMATVIEAPPPPAPVLLPAPPKEPVEKQEIIAPPQPIQEKPPVEAVAEVAPQIPPVEQEAEAVAEPAPEKRSVPSVPAPAVVAAPPPPASPTVTKRKPEPEPATAVATPPKPPATLKRITVPPPTKRQEAREFADRARTYEEDGLLDQAVEAYSQALRRDPDLIAAYLGRGWSYLGKGQTENAIGDFSRALERHPNHAEAYFARAWAHERMGSVDKATADYGQVVRLRPDYVPARFSRGIMHFHRQRFDLAARDFTDVLGRGNGELDRYSLLWRYLSRRRAGTTGSDELMAGVGNVDILEWPGVIVSLYLGRVGPERVLSSARDADPRHQREKQCVAYFFLGQLSLANGDVATAAAHFQKTVDTGVTDFRQYWAAKQELRRLGEN